MRRGGMLHFYILHLPQNVRTKLNIKGWRTVMRDFPADKLWQERNVDNLVHVLVGCLEKFRELTGLLGQLEGYFYLHNITIPKIVLNHF
jgi:hypothetical protein